MPIQTDKEKFAKKIRKLAITLLSSENAQTGEVMGITGASYDKLWELLMVTDNKDITKLVDACDDAFFLPDDHGLS